jgi:hypothetical protein
MSLPTHFLPVPAVESARRTLTEITPVIPAIRTAGAKSAPDCCRNVAVVNPPFTSLGASCGDANVTAEKPCRRALCRQLPPYSPLTTAASVDKGTGFEKCQTSIPGRSLRPIINASRKSGPTRKPRLICLMARSEFQRSRPPPAIRAARAIPAIRLSSSNWTSAGPRSPDLPQELADLHRGTKMVPRFVCAVKSGAKARNG